MGERGLLISRRTFLGGAAAFGVISLTNPLIAFATPTVAEKQAEADDVRVQVEALSADLSQKSNAYGAALDEQDAAIAAMEATQIQIDEVNVRIAEVQNHLGTRARSMYRSGGSSFLDILFGATTFTEFATNWDLLDKMNEDDAAMVSEAKVLREDLQALKDDYAAQELLAAEKAEEARVAKIEAENLTAEYQALLDSLDAEVLELIRQEEEAAAAAAAALVIAQQESQANNGGSSNDSNGGSSGGGNASDYGPPAGDVVSEAAKYIGVRYVGGGNSPDEGFDCSGLVCYCYRRVGRSVPPRSTYGYPGGNWFPVSQAQPGDILWKSDHVGICTSAGGGSYIHASMSQGQVVYGSYQQFTRAYRY